MKPLVVAVRLVDDCGYCLVVQSDNGRHSTGRRLSGIAHGLTTTPHQTETIGHTQRPSRGQRRELAQTVPREKADMVADSLDTRPEHRPESHGAGIDGRLGVGRVVQHLGRALKADPAQRKAQRVIGHLEQRAGLGIVGVERGTHAHRLTSLARKQQRKIHR